MGTELATQNQQQPAFMQQRALSANVNQGAIAIEQERAIAEAQGKLILAKRFPRDENQAFSLLMRACASRAFADTAFYTVPNRGHGPSIRMAEEVARCYGNFVYGHRELSRSEGKSEIEVYAWDMERNIESSRQVTVLHIIDATNGGPRPCKTQSDIDARIANVASKQMRGRILALMPKWLVAEAIEACKATLAGTSTEPIEQRVIRLQKAFAKLEITSQHLERYLGHPLKDIIPEEIVDLQGVFNAIKEGTPASDFFEPAKTEAEPEAIATVAAAAQVSAAKEAEQPRQRTTKKKDVPPPDDPEPPQVTKAEVEPKAEPEPVVVVEAKEEVVPIAAQAEEVHSNPEEDDLF